MCNVIKKYSNKQLPNKIGRKASESDYEYELFNKNSKNILVIRDLNKGNLSVSNNIEAILSHIFTTENYDFDTPVIYRDSLGNYDGIMTNGIGNVSFYKLVVGKLVRDECEALEYIANML